MKISIHQPCFIPWPGFFEKLLQVDKFVILDTVQFEKNSFDNRNKLRDAASDHWLTVPVFTKGKFGQNPWRDLLINNDIDWRSKHLKSIRMWYGKSRYFEEVYPIIDCAYAKRHRFLFDLNISLILSIMAYLEIRTPLIFASDLSLSSKKSELVLDIALSTGATSYYSGTKGQNYLDLASFASNSISITFQSYNPPVYKQLYKPFIPCLSIVDLLFSVGKESLRCIAT